MIKYLHFYSVWSGLLHVIHLFNIIENTFPIALFVLSISQFFLFIYPCYIRIMKINWINEFILHWLPVLLIEHEFNNLNSLYISFSIYALIFNKQIIVIYSDPIRYLSNK